MKKALLVVPLLALLAACGGSSSGGGGPVQQQAPQTKDYTSVNVNGGMSVDVTKTNLYGYTCLVGVESSYYHDYAPAIWCDPSPKGSTAP